MDQDRNLLFGVFAVQLNKVTPSQIIGAAAAWAADRSKDLPERLADSKEISEKDCKLINRLVADAIDEHGGDAAATLQDFGGENVVNLTFSGSIILTPSGDVTEAGLGKVSRRIEDPQSVPGVHEIPGRYTRESEHGRGGMGRVVLVHDEYLGRDVALKELLTTQPIQLDDDSPEHKRDQMALSLRFLQEARITSRLEHPAIVPVHELGHRLDGTLYYTMKYVRGQSFASVISKGRTLEARLGLLSHYVDLCQAIAYAHSRGVIHRDIKPANVMVGEFGETVVIDWGLAKMERKGESELDELATTLGIYGASSPAIAARTAYGQAIGTPAYMPPEQARGQINSIDKRSDVYALGSVLYELLTGQKCFEGSDAEEALKKVISEEPTPIRSLEPNSPAELVDICQRAMRKKPTDRYQTVTELAEEIQRYQSGAIVRAHEYQMSEHFFRFVSRRKTILAWSAAALLAFVAFGAYSYISVLRARNHERNARAIAESASIDANLAQKETATALRRAEGALYQANIHLAANRLDEGRLQMARAALEKAPARLRNWEWGYLLREADPGSNQVDPTLPDEIAVNVPTSEVWKDSIAINIASFKGHAAEVFSVSLSPNNGRLVTASNDGTARVWDLQTQEELAVLAEDGNPLQCAALNAEGSRIVTGHFDGTAYIWELEAGGKRVVLAGHTESVLDAKFSPDGTLAVTLSGDKTAKLWDTGSGLEVATLSGHTAAVVDVEFAMDGTRVLTASLDGTVKTWDTKTGGNIRTVAGPAQEDLYAIQLSSTLEFVASTQVGDDIQIWDAENGNALWTLTVGGGRVNLAVFSEDGTCLVAPAESGGAILWDVANGEVIGEIAKEAGELSSVIFHPSEKSLIAGEQDGGISIWKPQLRAGSTDPGLLAGHSDIVFYAGFDRDGSRLVSASYDKTARVWDVQTGRELARLGGHDIEVSRAEFSPDGRYIVTTTWDVTSKIWDAQTYSHVGTIHAAEGSGTVSTILGGPRGELVLRISPAFNTIIGSDSSYLFYPTIGRTAEIRELPDGRLRFSLPKQNTQIISWTMDEAGSRLITCSFKGIVKVWDATSGEELFTLTGHRGTIISVAFSPDGSRILTAGFDNTARIWDGATGTELQTLTGHHALLALARFSWDGETVLTASVDTTAILWDANEGKRLATFSGHTGPLINAAFSPDGTRILTSSLETTKVWSLDGQELVTLPGDGLITYSAWSPDGLRIVTCSRAGTIRLWEALRWQEPVGLAHEFQSTK